MIQNKRPIAFGLCAALLLSFSGCGKDKSVKYEPLSEEDTTVYSICMTQDVSDTYHDTIALGFQDAMMDMFGENHITISDSLQADTQLIFANGEQSLEHAASTTSETPIVGAGVIDYQHLLHLTVGAGDKWDKKTGTNVTGVTSQPDIEAQLSLLIETAPELKSVGLFYTADDSQSLVYLAQMEKYLDQAGIPWKEYAIMPEESETAVLSGVNLDNISLNGASADSGDASDADGVSDDGNDSDDASGSDVAPAPVVISPSKYIAPSATEGNSIDVEIFGEGNLIDGIISPNSAHAPLTSQFWTEDLSAANTEPLAEDASLEEIITYAAAECSAFFIPSDSLLLSQMEDIVDIATKAGVVTVGGDSNIGKYTLTSTYTDPYTLGYAAGKKAYRILVNGDLPGEMKITSPDMEVHKLYNAELAKTFEISFPKSFHEYNEFIETYQVGSSTSRVSAEDTEEE